MNAPTEYVLLVHGSGSLIGCTLGLIGGGESIHAMPLLICGECMNDVHMANGAGALAASANAYLNLVGQIAVAQTPKFEPKLKIIH
ncbi:hypothetical protein [Agrobacterium tumefaciens]|uniref:hypothetical protein n=1 Tax=Agrobacterium tumefaciens TaxID=358 RepID=UPI0007126924|nr:hypothetical protein ASD74_21095 [Rhizobium sp. Root564]NTC84135.1 hypothetical protein [Agrobacterium tumefaciens]NTD11660.1 hypothetical protein [Agrobacterium tumefaciens]